MTAAAILAPPAPASAPRLVAVERSGRKREIEPSNAWLATFEAPRADRSSPFEFDTCARSESATGQRTGAPCRKPRRQALVVNEVEDAIIAFIDGKSAPPPRAPYRRPSRASFEPKPEPARGVQPLTQVEHEEVMAKLKERSRCIRQIMLFAGTREDWIAGVWLEIVNPPAGISQTADLSVRIDRAIWRFEREQRRQMRFFMPQTILSNVEV